MNLDKLPPKIQKKIDSGKRLLKKEKDVFRSLEEMRQDLAKAPEERTKGHWKELHEIDEWAMILGAEDLDVELFSDSSEEEHDSDDENKRFEAAKETTKSDKDRAAETVVDEMDFAEDVVSTDDSHDENVEPPSSSEDDEDDVHSNEQKAKVKPPSKSHEVLSDSHTTENESEEDDMSQEDKGDKEDIHPEKAKTVTKPDKNRAMESRAVIESNGRKNAGHLTQKAKKRGEVDSETKGRPSKQRRLSIDPMRGRDSSCLNCGVSNDDENAGRQKKKSPEQDAFHRSGDERDEDVQLKKRKKIKCTKPDKNRATEQEAAIESDSKKNTSHATREAKNCEVNSETKERTSKNARLPEDLVHRGCVNDDTSANDENAGKHKKKSTERDAARRSDSSRATQQSVPETQVRNSSVAGRPASESNTNSDTDEKLSANVNRFAEIIKVIKECQVQVRELADDKSRTRLEIAKEIMFWRRQEGEWKKKLPYYDECIQSDDDIRMSEA